MAAFMIDTVWVAFDREVDVYVSKIEPDGHNLAFLDAGNGNPIGMTKKQAIALAKAILDATDLLPEEAHD